MTQFPTWEANLTVFGPIKTERVQSFKVFKDFHHDNPFYSDISLSNVSYGLTATVTAFASTSEFANKAALLFFGKMLDTLSLKIRQPIFLSFSSENPIRIKPYSVRRIIEKDEWKTAFQESRLLNEKEPTFLRALGWYRKGQYTDDPFDKFLAYWNSIEITATKYHTPTHQTQNGSKNQIWECFKTLWGDCTDWPTIQGNENWIKDNYEIRTNIAHGLTPITVDEVEKIVNKIAELERVAHNFLTNWREKELSIKDHLSPLLEHIGVEHIE